MIMEMKMWSAEVEEVGEKGEKQTEKNKKEIQRGKSQIKKMSKKKQAPVFISCKHLANCSTVHVAYINIFAFVLWFPFFITSFCCFFDHHSDSHVQERRPSRTNGWTSKYVSQWNPNQTKKNTHWNQSNVFALLFRWYRFVCFVWFNFSCCFCVSFQFYGFCWLLFFRKL